MSTASQGRLNVPFVGIVTFLRARICEQLDQIDADIAVLGVPTDEGSPFMPGSRFGPRSLREHSMRFVSGERGYYDPIKDRRFLDAQMGDGGIVDTGDVDILPTNVIGTFVNITNAVQAILKRGSMPLVLGGDHAITFPVVRAFADETLHVVHFDAHLDTQPFVHGVELSNGTPIRHIAKMAHVKGIHQVGIRSIRNTEVMMRDAVSDGNEVVTMAKYRHATLPEVFSTLPEGGACYVSIDIDVLDSTLIPGCVSAEPDGMTYRELADCLQYLAEHTEVVGCDLVEINPQLDVGTGVTSYLGAHVLIEFLGAICAQEAWTVQRRRRREMAAKRSGD
jgi:agmatinase